MKRSPIALGNKFVGEGHPCVIVFEAGPTHTGMETARRLVDVAVEAGADAIKFQILDARRLIGEADLEVSYGVLRDRTTNASESVTERLLDVLLRRELPRDDWRLLKRYCDERGIIFFATVDYEDTVDFVAELGCHAIKVCSGDVIHHRLIAYAARTGIPIMLDTGSSTLGEIERAVDVCREHGNERIIIHHCPSGYPARLESINLNVIKTLKQMFEYPIAFSDHTPGWDMDIAAVALGVAMVEKTVTVDRMQRGCEHMMSVEPHEAKAFVRAIRDVETAMGKARRLMSQEEAGAKLKARRSLFAVKDLKPGTVLSPDHVDYRRPGTGILPDKAEEAFGRVLKKAVRAGTMIRWTDFA